MQNPHYARGAMLYDQGRFDLAEPHFRRALAAEPDDGASHAILAICLAARGALDEAAREADEGVRLQPQMSLAHFARARVRDFQNRVDEAEAAIREAIRLNPEEPANFCLLAGLHDRRERWDEVVEVAEQGLRLDPTHEACSNLRALALVRLRRTSEAQEAIEAALKHNPENAFTQATMGWLQLEKGDPLRAMQHFRESLRIDPRQNWAKEGIVAGLKAINPLYGLLLRFQFWLARLPSEVWSVVTVGFIVGVSVSLTLWKDRPDLRPVLATVGVALGSFVLALTFADPLFNLVLRTHPIGRHALSPEQVRTSNWLGGALVLLGLTAVGYAFSGFFSTVVGAVLVASAVAAAAKVKNSKPGRRRVAIAAAFLVVHGVGLVGLVGSVLFEAGQLAREIWVKMASATFIGFGMGSFYAWVEAGSLEERPNGTA